MSSDGNQLPVGSTLEDRYQIKGLIGQGGMSRVYLAADATLGLDVAIKVLTPEAAGDFKKVERFVQEARAAASIGHPGIVKVFDIGQTDEGIPFLVMEKLDGSSLAERLEEEGLLPEAEVAEIGTRILSALASSHAKGIIHRDIKPENVFLTRSGDGAGKVKVLDFGISIIATTHESMRLTHTGTILGTPYYMSPEQARGAKDLDHRVDLWSVGVVLYEAVTGELPYEGESYNELLIRIVNEAYPPPSQLKPDVNPQLERVILRAMTKRREARYPSAQEFLNDLKGVQATLKAGGALARPSSAPLPATKPRPKPARRPPLVKGEGRREDGARGSRPGDAPREGRKDRTFTLLVAGGLVAILGGVVVGVSMVMTPPPVPAAPPDDAIVGSTLESDGGTGDPAERSAGDAGGPLATADDEAGADQTAPARAAEDAGAAAPPSGQTTGAASPATAPTKTVVERPPSGRRAPTKLTTARPTEATTAPAAPSDQGAAAPTEAPDTPTETPTKTASTPPPPPPPADDEDETPPAATKRPSEPETGTGAYRPRKTKLAPYPFANQERR